MTRTLFLAFALLLAVKIVLLFVIGVVFTPDSPSYSGPADIMLSSSAWLHDAGIAQSYAPPLTFRSIGYPLVIAAAKLAAGGGWPYAVIGSQFAASLLATWAVFRLGLKLALDWRWSLAAALAFATSVQLVIDQCILTDSLNASAIILAIAIFLAGGESGQPLRGWQIAATGMLLAVAFLFREVLPLLIVTLLPLFAVRCWTARRTFSLKMFAPCVLVCIPLVVANEGYKVWNVHRTGERFVTTGAQLNAMLSMARASNAGANLFAGHPPIDRVAERVFKHYDLTEVWQVNAALFDEGYRAPAIARMATNLYFAAWREHPSAMLRLVGISTSESLFKLALRPVSAVCDLIEWAELPRCLDYRDLYRKLGTHPFDMTAKEGMMFAIITVQNVLSIALTAIFLVGVPFLVALSWRDGALATDRVILTVGAFWILFVGWHLIHAVAVYQDRYLAPVIPFLILGGIVAGNRLAARRQSRKQSSIP